MNNIIRKIDKDGNISEVATYDGKFSAEYAMVLFICQHNRRDFFNTHNHAWAKEKMFVGKLQKAVYYEQGDDTYSCVAHSKRKYNEGVSGSKFDFRPFIP